MVWSFASSTTRTHHVRKCGGANKAGLPAIDPALNGSSAPGSMAQTMDEHITKLKLDYDRMLADNEEIQAQNNGLFATKHGSETWRGKRVPSSTPMPCP